MQYLHLPGLNFNIEPGSIQRCCLPGMHTINLIFPSQNIGSVRAFSSAAIFELGPCHPIVWPTVPPSLDIIKTSLKFTPVSNLDDPNLLIMIGWL